MTHDSGPAALDASPARLPDDPPAPQPAAPRAPFRLPVKQLLLVLGLVATGYAAALLIWGGRPDAVMASLARLWSPTGLQAVALCLLGYGLRGMRWRCAAIPRRRLQLAAA